MINGGSGVSRSGALSGAKRRPSCPGSLQHVACAPTAAEPPVAEAQLRTYLEWLDAYSERAVDERCAVANSSARARAAVSARWSHRYAPTQCNAPKTEDSNVEGKRELFYMQLLCTGEVSADLQAANRVLRKAPKQSVSPRAESCRMLSASRNAGTARTPRQTLAPPCHQPAP